MYDWRWSGGQGVCMLTLLWYGHEVKCFCPEIPPLMSWVVKGSKHETQGRFSLYNFKIGLFL